MRTKVTLVLLLLNVVLFFFIFVFGPKWRTDALLDQNRTRVLGPEAAAIQSLEISGGRLSETVRIEKRADGWLLTKPVEWPANPHAVSRILNELMLLDHYTSFLVKDLAKSGLSLADYGLDKPQFTLTFTSGNSGGLVPGNAASAPVTTTTLLIGDMTKVGNRLYVLSPDGKRIHVVGRSLADSLSLTVNQLQADTIFNIQLFEIRSFNLQTGAPGNLRVRLRHDGSRWSFEAPILARASPIQVELAINSLHGLHTYAFMENGAALPPDRTGLNNPAFRLTLEGNGRRETLLLGNPVPVAEEAPGSKPAAREEPSEPATEYYARMEDRAPIFTVKFPNTLYTTLRSAQEELRDRHLLDFDSLALTSLTLVAPNRPELTLQRLGNPEQPQASDPWQIVTRATNQAPQTLPAELPLVQRLIEKLQSLQALKFLRDAPQNIELENWGFNRPEREITLNFTTKGVLTGGGPAGAMPSSVTLLIGVASERDGLAYAKLANEPFVYLVDPDILRQSPIAVPYYRSRLLRELPAGARVTGLSLTDTVTKTVLFARRLPDGGSWDGALAAEPEAKRNALVTVLNQLASLRARSFVLDSFPPSVEIGGETRTWKYALDASIALVGGTGGQTETITVFFTERVGGETQFAGSPGFNVVFEPEQKLLDALFALTHTPPEPEAASPTKPAQPEAQTAAAK